MTQAPAKQDLWLFTGTVTAINENGMKLDSYGDEWINYTKAEWRGSWYDASKVAVARTPGTPSGAHLKPNRDVPP